MTGVALNGDAEVSSVGGSDSVAATQPPPRVDPGYQTARGSGLGQAGRGD